MVVVIFRSRMRDDAGPEYGPLSDRMLELARAMPGFISFRHFKADDGERVSIIEFQDEATLAAWHAHPEHRYAQKRGREQFYADFHLQVLTPIRAYEFHYEAK